jgi:ubiquinol-cytochrome c reductase cytochrome b subunit
MPPWEPSAFGCTFVPNPFWGGAAFPLVVFGTLALWPSIERRLTGDRGFHNLLDRPRDAPWRTAFGSALVTWVFLIFVAGSADRVDVFFGLSYVNQIYAYWVVIWVLPVVVFALVYRACRGLQKKELLESDQHRAEIEARAARTAV